MLTPGTLRLRQKGIGTPKPVGEEDAGRRGVNCYPDIKNVQQGVSPDAFTFPFYTPRWLLATSPTGFGVPILFLVCPFLPGVNTPGLDIPSFQDYFMAQDL